MIGIKLCIAIRPAGMMAIHSQRPRDSTSVNGQKEPKKINVAVKVAYLSNSLTENFSGYAADSTITLA
jgi:hypothetical protein